MKAVKGILLTAHFLLFAAAAVRMVGPVGRLFEAGSLAAVVYSEGPGHKNGVRTDVTVRSGEAEKEAEMPPAPKRVKSVRNAVLQPFTEPKAPPDFVKGLGQITKYRGELPASYDGRRTGRTPAVKNQGTSGTCWAFASLIALEAGQLPAHVWDFSEDHMSLGNGFGISQDDGGDYTMSMAYLLSWKGPVLEEDDPYGDGFSPEGLEAVKHVQGILKVPGKDYRKVKRAVLQYGGVQSSLYTSITDKDDRRKWYDKESCSYCYKGTAPPNHDCVIIGWDDGYPKENFKGNASEDGAFICMNSWGVGFGDSGYFYVSYDDANIGMNNIIYTDVEEPDNYDHNYQTDLRGFLGQLGYGADTVWISNVYKARGKEELQAVGFYTTGRHTSYEVYFVPAPGTQADIETGQSFLNRELAASGNLDLAGFYTIPLDGILAEKRKLLPGERFAVLVKLTTPAAVHPAAVEYDSGEGSGFVDISDGEGYISPDGITFRRSEQEQLCNICLKAYTVNR